MGNVYENAREAENSLAYWTGELFKALTGEHLSLPRDQTQRGPFALAMQHIAEIADTGKVADPEKAKSDMLYVFRFIDFVGGLSSMAVQPVIDAAMERIGELIDVKEASQILGEPEFIIESYDRIRALHPLYRKDGESFDGPYLARYEVEDLKARKIKKAEILAEIKSKQNSKKGEGL